MSPLVRWLSVGVAAVSAAALAVPRLLTPPPGTETVLFFDGVCNMCDGFVNFVVDRDPSAAIRFGAIQKHMALLDKHGAPTDLSTVVLVQGKTFYTHSGAALRIFALLQQPWRSVSVFYLVPNFLRDAIYKFIAHNRYSWFGEVEQCRAPDPDFDARFLPSEDGDEH